MNLLKVWNQHRIFLIKHNDIADAIDLSGDSKKNMITKNGYEKLKKKLSEEWNSATYYYMKSILILTSVDFYRIIYFLTHSVFQQMIYLLNNMNKLVNKMVKWENYVR